MNNYDAWKLASPYDDECPECANHGTHDCMNCGGDGEVADGVDCPCCDGSGEVECATCAKARDDAEGLGDYRYEQWKDDRMREKWDAEK